MTEKIYQDPESAVSPVVGVMLMLVVCIIIAAVVSAFAGGLGSGTEIAPQTSIDVSFSGDSSDWMMMFTHASGDTILTKDIEIITYYTHPNGTVIKHIQSRESPMIHLYPTSSYSKGKWYRIPFLNDMKTGYAGNNTAKDFGNFTWKTGDIMSTQNSIGTSEVLGFDVTDSEYYFDSGSAVDVKIMHVPSKKYIFDKEVIVP